MTYLSASSARSRVKGYLELYHAFVREEGQRTDNDDNRIRRIEEGEPGWEMVDNNISNSTNVETPAQVLASVLSFKYFVS